MLDVVFGLEEKKIDMGDRKMKKWLCFGHLQA